MGDAWKGRRLLVAAAVAAAVLVGVGAAAQGGLLSRAESSETDTGGSSRGAGAAIADPSGMGGDAVAVAETTATSDDGNFESSATLLRVGDTKVGETPVGVEQNPLGDALEGQATEDLIDAGCNDDPAETQTGSCLSLLKGGHVSDDDSEFGGAFAYFYTVEGYTPITGYFLALASAADEDACSGDAGGVLFHSDATDSIDLSLASHECPE